MFEYFLFKPNTAYDLRFIDWISDVCSSDLKGVAGNVVNLPLRPFAGSTEFRQAMETVLLPRLEGFAPELLLISAGFDAHMSDPLAQLQFSDADYQWATEQRSEEHTSELQSLMRISYAVFCLNKKLI